MKTGLNIKVNMHMSWPFKEKNKEQLDHNQFRNGTKNLELRLVLSSVSLRYHPGLCSPCYQLPRHGHDLCSLSSHLRLFFSFSFWRQNLLKKKKKVLFFIGDCEDPLENEMATHSNILAWETPRTEELGSLFVRSQKSWTRLSN